MLKAGLTFPGTGAIGPLNASSFFGNEKAIQAVTVQKTAVGQYTITFLSGRDLKVTQPPAVTITAQDNTGNILTTQLVQPVQFTFNANAQDYQWRLQLKIIVQKIAPAINVLILGSYTILTPTDPLLVMVNISAANSNGESEIDGVPDLIHEQWKKLRYDLGFIKPTPDEIESARINREYKNIGRDPYIKNGKRPGDIGYRGL